MKKYIRPQNITAWVVVGGLLLSAGIYAFRRILIFSNPNYDFLPIFDRLIIFDNFELLGFGIGMCAMIISGLQKLSLPTKHKGIFYLIAGSLIGSLLIGLNILASFLLPSLVQKLMISDERIVQIESRLNTKNTPPDLKNRLREIVAEEKYLKTGVVSKYVNAGGETVEYKPTSKTLETRKSIEQIMNASSRAQTWSMLWGAVLIFSLLMGFIIARYRVANQN